MMAKERLVERYGDDPLHDRHRLLGRLDRAAHRRERLPRASTRAWSPPAPTPTRSPPARSSPTTTCCGSTSRTRRAGRPAWSGRRRRWPHVEGHLTHLNAVVADEGLFKAALNPENDCSGTVDPVAGDPSHPLRLRDQPRRRPLLGARPAWSTCSARVRSRCGSAEEQAAGHGFGGVPFANTGVLYGLDALKPGTITPAQFVDLNEKVGGLDVDSEPVAGADRRRPGRRSRSAYRTGLINEANHLDEVAIINHGGPDPGIAHDYAHAFWTEERLLRRPGPHRQPGDVVRPDPADRRRRLGQRGADRRWTAGSPPSSGHVRDAAGREDRRPTSPPTSPTAASSPTRAPACARRASSRRCRPGSRTPRQEAGGPLANDNVACRLTPLDRAAFDFVPVPFTDDRVGHAAGDLPRRRLRLVASPASARARPRPGCATTPPPAGSCTAAATCPPYPPTPPVAWSRPPGRRCCAGEQSRIVPHVLAGFAGVLQPKRQGLSQWNRPESQRRTGMTTLRLLLAGFLAACGLVAFSPAHVVRVLVRDRRTRRPTSTGRTSCSSAPSPTSSRRRSARSCRARTRTPTRSTWTGCFEGDVGAVTEVESAMYGASCGWEGMKAGVTTSCSPPTTRACWPPASAAGTGPVDLESRGDHRAGHRARSPGRPRTSAP